MPHPPFEAFLVRHAGMRAQAKGRRAPDKANLYAQRALGNAHRASLQEISAQTGIDRQLITWALKKTYGKSFQELQKEARLAFIEQHQNLPDKALATHLGMTVDGVSKYVAFLKAQRRIPDAHRQTGKNYLARDALPFQRQPIAYEILSTLGWIKNGSAFSTQELVQATGKHKESLHRVLRGLRTKNLVSTQKQGKQFVFRITPDGHQWLRKMVPIIRARERKARKGVQGMQILLRKREAQKQRLMSLKMFLEQQGERVKAEEVACMIQLLGKGENLIRSEIVRMQTRQAKGAQP